MTWLLSLLLTTIPSRFGALWNLCVKGLTISFHLMLRALPSQMISALLKVWMTFSPLCLHQRTAITSPNLNMSPIVNFQTDSLQHKGSRKAVKKFKYLQVTWTWQLTTSHSEGMCECFVITSVFLLSELLSCYEITQQHKANWNRLFEFFQGVWQRTAWASSF